MGNSISLNVLADDTHLTVNSQLTPRPGNGQLNSPRSPRSDASSDVSGPLLSSDSNLESMDSLSDGHGSPPSTIKEDGLSSPMPKSRQCWICYGEEEIVEGAEFAGRWVAPCKCKGTTKWVHQACLLDWIDSQVISNATLRNSPGTPLGSTATTGGTLGTPGISPLSTSSPMNPRFQAGDRPLVLESVNLSCPQCHTPYRISEAHALPRKLLLFIDNVAKIKERTLMWSTLGLISGSIYTVAFSYGLFSGWMLGGQEYFDYIKSTFDPIQGNYINRLQLAVGIPMAPLFALSSAFSMFSWTFPLVPLFLLDGHHRISLTHPRGILLILPLIWSSHRIIVDGIIPLIYNRRRQQEIRNNIDIQESSASSSSSSSLSSTLISNYSLEDEEDIVAPGSSTVKISILSTTAALLFPSISAVTGWALTALLPQKLNSRLSPLHKSLIGAAVLTLIKDLSKLLYWYQTVKLRKYRHILNRVEELK